MEKLRAKEQYKRLVKLSFAVVMIVGLCMMYGVTWIGYYNRFILQEQYRFFRRGNWLVVLLYGILLIFFMNTYGGFKVGYLKKGNLIYSQILSVVFTNIFTYFQIAAIDKRFVNPIYIILMTAAEIFFIVVWTLIFQLLYRDLFPPRRMLFVQGDRRDYHLMDKINAREDKYEICEVFPIKRECMRLQIGLQHYDAGDHWRYACT